MRTCTFFGHRDCPAQIYDILKEKTEELIVQLGVRTFYVGSEGKFDMIVCDVLSELKNKYPFIRFCVVLSYLNNRKEYMPDDIETVYPEGLELRHKRFAIVYRNDWMLDRADVAVCYVNRNYGGAWRSYEKAKKRNKTVYNLATKNELYELGF